MSEHIHEWRVPDGPYVVIGTYPAQRPYRCACGAFTHDPDTGVPCAICDPADYAQRTNDLVLLRGGPLDGTWVARPANARVLFLIDPPERRAQKHLTYRRSNDDRNVYEFFSNDWTVPLEPRTHGDLGDG